jgi:hypothetical protein
MRMALGLGALVLSGALSGVLSGCTSAETVSASAGQTSIANSCIDPREITKQSIVSDQEIRFELRNGETWVNRFPRACSGLKIEGGFAWDIHGTLACSNQERITVLHSGTPCQIGEFSRVAS